MSSVLTVGENIREEVGNDFENVIKELTEYITRYTPKTSSVLLTVLNMASLAENSEVEDKRKTLKCIKEIRDKDGVQVLIPHNAIGEYLSTLFHSSSSARLISKYGGVTINLAFMTGKENQPPIQIPQYRLHDSVVAYQLFLPMSDLFDSELSGKRFIVFKEQDKPCYINEATISLIKQYKEFFYDYRVTAKQLEQQRAEREYALMEEMEKVAQLSAEKKES